MALILQIETATQTCSVALAKDGVILDFIERTERNIHASVITLFIDELLRKNNFQFSDLSAVAISMGPGSYTGLRIGVSTSKGICYALDIPLIAVNTLEAMSSGFVSNHFSVNPDTLFCPMIDARRMEVYCAIYTSKTEVVLETKAEIIDENSFRDILDHQVVYFFGDGALKCESYLGTHFNARVIDDFESSARYLTAIAYQKYLQKDFVDVAYFEPFYLKDFVAGKKKSN